MSREVQFLSVRLSLLTKMVRCIPQVFMRDFDALVKFDEKCVNFFVEWWEKGHSLSKNANFRSITKVPKGISVAMNAKTAHLNDNLPSISAMRIKRHKIMNKTP